MVRRGLARWVAGSTITDVEVRHPRPVRRHLAGAADFAARLAAPRYCVPCRRGKFLWLTLDSGRGAAGAPRDERPARAAAAGRAGGGATCGCGSASRRRRPRRTVASCGSSTSGCSAVWPSSRWCRHRRPAPAPRRARRRRPVLPVPVAAHRPRPARPARSTSPRSSSGLRKRRTGIKRALLDQTLVSGIGNIYADEALWRARLHYARPTETLTRPALRRLLAAVRTVMREALAAGRDQLRQPVRRRERQQRVLRPLAGGLRPGGPAVPALRHPDPARRVHEPVVVQLPALPAAPAPRPLVAAPVLRTPYRGSHVVTAPRRPKYPVATPTGRANPDRTCEAAHCRAAHHAGWRTPVGGSVPAVRGVPADRLELAEAQRRDRGG